MKLNENLRICLLAVASRYPTSTIVLNEEAIGPQCPRTGECTPSGLLELLQSNAPQMLSVPAQLVLEAQERVIYLGEQSQQALAFRIHYRERTQGEEIASLRRENAVLRAENRELKTRLAQMLPV